MVKYFIGMRMKLQRRLTNQKKITIDFILTQV
jgi:hypothetical protein